MLRNACSRRNARRCHLRHIAPLINNRNYQYLMSPLRKITCFLSCSSCDMGTSGKDLTSTNFILECETRRTCTFLFGHAVFNRQFKLYFNASFIISIRFFWLSCKSLMFSYEASSLTRCWSTERMWVHSTRARPRSIAWDRMFSRLLDSRKITDSWTGGECCHAVPSVAKDVLLSGTDAVRILRSLSTTGEGFVRG